LVTTRFEEGAEQRIWVPARFLDWDYGTYSTESLEPADLERAYSIWEHASNKLSATCGEFDRVDVVTTLKRAVTQRVSALKKHYGFHLLPLANRPKRDLDVLHFLGVIRPIMLRNLIEIRNTLEHEDAAPPEHDACLALVEFVWYFLKSTDPLLRLRLSEIDYDADFDEPQDEESIQFAPENYPEHVWVGYLHPSQGPPSISIRLPKVAIEQVSRQGYFEVVETGARRKVHERDDLTIVQGSIVGPDDLLQRLWLTYFQGLPRSR
jgi:hypothetical protein